MVLGHAKAIDEIQTHMNQQANGNDSDFWDGQASTVDRDGNIRMERVESDTAPVRIIDWCCQQVVQVHHHCRAQHEAHLELFLHPEKVHTCDWHQEMQHDMKKRSHGVGKWGHFPLTERYVLFSPFHFMLKGALPTAPVIQCRLPKRQKATFFEPSDSINTETEQIAQAL